jgi:hypothetical protein
MPICLEDGILICIEDFTGRREVPEEACSTAAPAQKNAIENQPRVDSRGQSVPARYNSTFSGNLL